MLYAVCKSVPDYPSLNFESSGCYVNIVAIAKILYIVDPGQLHKTVISYCSSGNPAEDACVIFGRAG